VCGGGNSEVLLPATSLPRNSCSKEIANDVLGKSDLYFVFIYNKIHKSEKM
jgi:hypothetical protein